MRFRRTDVKQNLVPYRRSSAERLADKNAAIARATREHNYAMRNLEIAKKGLRMAKRKYPGRKLDFSSGTARPTQSRWLEKIEHWVKQEKHAFNDLKGIAKMRF